MSVTDGPPPAVTAAARAADLWTLRLYVAGMTPTARTALANIERIGREHLQDRYTLEVIDLLEQPGLAESDQILAVPTLVRCAPPPTRRVIGDLSETQKVLWGLELQHMT